MTQISNINNTFESYQKLISFYQANKDKQFEDVAYFEPFYLKEFQGVKLADKNKKV